MASERSGVNGARHSAQSGVSLAVTLPSTAGEGVTATEATRVVVLAIRNALASVSFKTSPPPAPEGAPVAASAAGRC